VQLEIIAAKKSKIKLELCLNISIILMIKQMCQVAYVQN